MGVDVILYVWTRFRNYSFLTSTKIWRSIILVRLTCHARRSVTLVGLKCLFMCVCLFVASIGPQFSCLWYFEIEYCNTSALALDSVTWYTYIELLFSPGAVKCLKNSSAPSKRQDVHDFIKYLEVWPPTYWSAILVKQTMNKSTLCSNCAGTKPSNQAYSATPQNIRALSQLLLTVVLWWIENKFLGWPKLRDIALLYCCGYMVRKIDETNNKLHN